MKIDVAELSVAFADCFYRPEEIPEEGKIPDGAVLVEGILAKFGFHPERLQNHSAQVEKWLLALPHEFRKNEGGGYSFLAACNDDTGLQWGEHRDMDKLFCLGMALGLVRCLMPREMWSVLPGGMPYYAIDLPRDPATN